MLNSLTALYGTTPSALYASVDRVAQEAVPDNIKELARRLEREINERER
jgi:hypothetical protein